MPSQFLYVCMYTDVPAESPALFADYHRPQDYRRRRGLSAHYKKLTIRHHNQAWLELKYHLQVHA